MRFYLLGGAIALVGISGLVAMLFVPKLPQHTGEVGEQQERTEDGRLRVGGGFLGDPPEGATIVRRVEGGYEPKEVTVSQGETVSFVNESSEFHWPASDVHPTHSIYSEFDPREPVGPGETWSFTFTEAGTWGLHDHLRANYKGTITVEPVN